MFHPKKRGLYKLMMRTHIQKTATTTTTKHTYNGFRIIYDKIMGWKLIATTITKQRIKSLGVECVCVANDLGS